MRKVVLYIVCIVLGLQSCTKEDLDDCLYGLRLRVTYLLPYGDEVAPAPDVKHVRAYVFDKEEVLCAVAEEKGNCLASDSWMDINVAPGKYKILVWGSNATALETSYNIEATIGKTTLTDLQLSLKGATNETITEFIPNEENFSDLYYGMAGERTPRISEYVVKDVELTTGTIAEETIELIRNTHQLHVAIEGFRYLVPGWTETSTDIEVYATGKSATYQWENSFTDNSYQVKYSPYNKKTEDNKLLFDIKTQRVRLDMVNDKPFMFYIYDKTQQKVIYELDVLEQLLKVRDDNDNYIFRNQEDLDKTYIYNVRLRIGANLNITIFINNWEITNMYPVPSRF